MYEDQMEPGFPGMKCDSGDDRVETFPAAAGVPFGRVVATEPGGEVAALPAPPYTRLRGVALQSHTLDAYAQFDAVSVMTSGLAWAESLADVEPGPALVNEAGQLAPAGEALPNAEVRGPVVALEDGRFIAPLELHAPAAVSGPPPISPALTMLKALAAAAPSTVAALGTPVAGVVPVTGEANEPPQIANYQRYWVSGNGKNNQDGGTDNPRLQEVTYCFNFENWGYMYGAPGVTINFNDGSQADARAAYNGYGSSRPYIGLRTNSRYLAIATQHGAMIRLEVDDEQWPYHTTIGNNRYQNYDFGSAVLREIIIGGNANDCFFSDICIETGATIEPFDFMAERGAGTLCTATDSYGGYNDDVVSNLSFMEMIGRMLGLWGITETQRGSTGYQRNAGSAGWAAVEPERLAFVAAQPRLATLGQFGINDSIPRDPNPAMGPDIDTLDAITLTLTDWRETAADSVLIIQGPWAPNQSNAQQDGSKYRTIMAHVVATMQALGGDWIVLDNIFGNWHTSAGTERPTLRGAWQTGTGYEGNPQGNGNGDTWVQSDGTHPTVPVGITGLSEIAAAEIKMALASM